jgi:hypothetical protein
MTGANSSGTEAVILVPLRFSAENSAVREAGYDSAAD